MNPTITADFRDYSAELPEIGSFSLETRPGAPLAVFRATSTDDAEQIATFGSSMARDIGTEILQWAGNHSLWGEDTWSDEPRGRGSLRVIAEDGEITTTVSDAAPFTMSVDYAIDIAQRLIVWAGVKVTANA